MSWDNIYINCGTCGKYPEVEISSTWKMFPEEMLNGISIFTQINAFEARSKIEILQMEK